jgi:hypothetical protein
MPFLAMMFTAVDRGAYDVNRVFISLGGSLFLWCQQGFFLVFFVTFLIFAHGLISLFMFS